MLFSWIKAILKTMRPRQWPKNLVIFAALVFDRQLGLDHLDATLRTTAGFVIFCLVSGLVYIINDIADVEADRIHPDKRRRPIASGQLPMSVAIIAAVIIFLIAIPAAFWLSVGFGIVASSYFVLNLAYSKWIKHVPLLDVFTIALGFVLRVAAGVMLIQVSRFSPWLYVVVTLGALYLGFGKRRAETGFVGRRRKYSPAGVGRLHDSIARPVYYDCIGNDDLSL